MEITLGKTGFADRVAGIGGHLEPAGSAGEVAWDAVAIGNQEADLGHGIGIAVGAGGAKPIEGLRGGHGA